MSTSGRGNNFSSQSFEIVLRRDVSPVPSGYHGMIKHSFRRNPHQSVKIIPLAPVRCHPILITLCMVVAKSYTN